MRYSGAFVLVLVAALLPLACNRSSPTPVPNEKEQAEAAVKASRDEFLREMLELYAELDTKYKALEQRAAEAKGDAKKDLEEKLKVAKAKRDAVAKKVEKLKQASHDRWLKVLAEELKKDLEGE